MRPSRTVSTSPFGVFSQTRRRVSATRNPPSVWNGVFSRAAFETVR